MRTDLERLADRVIAVSPAIRYAAVSVGGQLVTRVAGTRENASAAESDLYEELFVNPTILDLTRRRGEAGCNGPDHVVIRYGAFSQLLVPAVDGHLSVCVEPEADALGVVDAVREVARSIVGAPPTTRPPSRIPLAPEPFVAADDAPAWMVEALPMLYGVADEIRYVALQAEGRLLLSSRLADPAGSEDRSDRYEELLVNPTLLTIAGQRGAIDCGGLRYLVVAYPPFFALVLPLPNGHTTISLPRDADPVALAPALEDAVRAIVSARP